MQKNHLQIILIIKTKQIKRFSFKKKLEKKSSKKIRKKSKISKQIRNFR